MLGSGSGHLPSRKPAAMEETYCAGKEALLDELLPVFVVDPKGHGHMQGPQQDDNVIAIRNSMCILLLGLAPSISMLAHVSLS